MQIRVCDRCRAAVPDPPTPAGVRGVTIPPDSPSTNPVTAPIDVNVVLTVQPPVDLCAPCRMSALTEYAGAEIRATNLASTIKALSARLVTILKGGA